MKTSIRDGVVLAMSLLASLQGVSALAGEPKMPVLPDGLGVILLHPWPG